MLTILGATSSVDLAGAWTTFWSSVSGSLKGFMSTLAIVGMLLVVGSIVMYVWERRRGGQANHSKVLWTMLIGGILAGPNIFIPGILTLADYVVNAIHSAIG